MRFSVERELFISALDRVRRVVPNQKESPHGQYARLQARDGALSIYGSDLTIFMSCRVATEVSSMGEIGVVPSELAEMVRRMPEGATITIAAAEGRARITADGSKRAFTLPYVETEDMPAHTGVSPAGIVTIAGDVLAANLKRVLVASYQSGDRPNMHGIGFDGRAAALHLAATDGKRVADVEVDGVFGDGNEKVRILHLAAARVVAAEAASMGSVGVVVDHRGFSFTSDDVDIFVPHVGADFPQYQAAFGMLNNHTTVSIDVQEALYAVQAMGAVSDVTKITLNGAFHLSAHGERDLAEDEVSGAIVGDGGVVFISTNLLIDALKGSPKARVDLAIGKDPLPILMSCEGYRTLIMPLAPGSQGAT